MKQKIQQNLEPLNHWSASGLAWKEQRHGKYLDKIHLIFVIVPVTVCR